MDFPPGLWFMRSHEPQTYMNLPLLTFPFNSYCKWVPHGSEVQVVSSPFLTEFATQTPFLCGATLQKPFKVFPLNVLEALEVEGNKRNS